MLNLINYVISILEWVALLAFGVTFGIDVWEKSCVFAIVVICFTVYLAFSFFFPRKKINVIRDRVLSPQPMSYCLFNLVLLSYGIEYFIDHHEIPLSGLICAIGLVLDSIKWGIYYYCLKHRIHYENQ